MLKILATFLPMRWRKKTSSNVGKVAHQAEGHVAKPHAETPDIPIPPHKPDLLNDCIEQWRRAEWESLASLKPSEVQHHSDRAHLAALISTGNYQLGRMAVAKEFAQLALEWGCSRKLMQKLMLTGLHETLQRAFTLAEDPQKPQFYPEIAKSLSKDRNKTSAFEPSEKQLKHEFISEINSAYARRHTEAPSSPSQALSHRLSYKASHTSIIIPFFNAKDYIQSCVEALQSQTHTDFEVLFINDGSSDEGSDLLKKSVNHDKRFRILDLDTNSGPAVARNMGIHEANGRYIRFMDVDDSLPPHSLITLLKHSKNQDFVRGSTEVVSQGKIHLDQTSDKNLIDLHPFIIPMPTRSKLVYGHCSMLFDKNFLINNDIYFPEHKRNAEDTTFLTDCFFAAERVTIVSDVVYQYIRHPDSLSNPSEPELAYFLNTLGRWLYIKQRAIKSGQPKILDEAFNNALRNYISKEQFPRIKKHLDTPDTLRLREALENVLRAYQLPIEPYLHFFEEEALN